LLLLSAAALAAAAGPAAAMPLVDRLIFHPQPLAGSVSSARDGVEEISLVAPDGIRLHGWFVRAQGRSGPAPVIVYFGGNAEEVSWMTRMSRQLPGWSLLLVNYRGYGRSEGEPAEPALFADAVVLHAYVAGRADVDPAAIVAMGRSLGSAVAVHLAAVRPLAGVVLVTPFDSVTDVAKVLFPLLPVEWLVGRRFDSLARAPAIRAPLLTLAAGRDSVVPPAHAARLHDAWGGPKTWRMRADADHNTISDDPAFWEEIRAFLASLHAR
jgi:hypothetical protein